MCLIDWQLGRLIRSQKTIMPAGLGTTLAFGGSQQRIAVNVAGTGSSFGSTTVGTVAINGVDTFQLDATVHFVYYNIKDFGDLPMQPFTLTQTVVGRVYCIVEFFLPEEFLNIPLEEFRKQYQQWRK